MKNNITLNIKRSVSALFFTLIVMQSFGQEMPDFDKIPTNNGTLYLNFIGHGSLMFKINDYVIYLDPVSSMGDYDVMPKADLILITHEHGDHLDPALIDKLKKQGTLVFCNKNSLAKIPWAMAVKAGDRQEVNNIVIEAVEAYNIVNERAPGQPYHPKGSGVGYVLTIGGKKIYVAGDTENTPEMKALKNIDVAFLPMNLPYTMTPEMVADAALAFRPQILYPYHYGDTDTSILAGLLKDSGIDVRIRKLK